MPDAVAHADARRRRIMLSATFVWFALALAAMVAPVYTTVANHIEPRVLGLPFSLVWVLGFIVANTVVLAWMYRGRLVEASDDEDASPGGEG